MGRRHKSGRAVQGVLLLDKPTGISSNHALQVVKRLYKANKAGHTGSLDPLACGLLPICLGFATKLSAYLLNADKRYQVRARLGQTTTTGDTEGEVTEIRPVPVLETKDIMAVLASFEGEIEQLPPMYSALRHKGKRLYELARQGVEVERKLRKITIHSLVFTGYQTNEISFEVHCSKGTYVRTLAEDIGTKIGCGAHVVGLRRTQVGPFGKAGWIGLKDLESLAEKGFDILDARLLVPDNILQDWSEVSLSGDAAYYLRQGQAVLVPRAPTSGWVRLYTQEGRFLGVGQIQDDGKVAPRRLVDSYSS